MRRARVEEYRRAALDALALGQLRESRKMTQQGVADALDVSQANISHIERQEDMYLSTLGCYAAALGGHLHVTAVFPDGSISLVGPGSEYAAEAAEAATAGG